MKNVKSATTTEQALAAAAAAVAIANAKAALHKGSNSFRDAVISKAEGISLFLILYHSLYI